VAALLTAPLIVAALLTPDPPVPLPLCPSSLMPYAKS
jgi:hypothetical protein